METIFKTFSVSEAKATVESDRVNILADIHKQVKLLISEQFVCLCSLFKHPLSPAQIHNMTTIQNVLYSDLQDIAKTVGTKAMERAIKKTILNSTIGEIARKPVVAAKPMLQNNHLLSKKKSSHE